MVGYVRMGCSVCWLPGWIVTHWEKAGILSDVADEAEVVVTEEYSVCGVITANPEL